MPLSKIAIKGLIGKAVRERFEIPTPRNQKYCDGMIRAFEDMLAGRNKMDEVIDALKRSDLDELKIRELTGYKNGFIFNTKGHVGGRKKLFNEPTKTITVRLPVNIIKKIPKPHNKTIRDILLERYE